MGLKNRLHYLFLGNGLSLWYLVRPYYDRKELREIKKGSLRGQVSAGKKTGDKSREREVVCLFEGHNYSGGLADRLRGIVSVYEECKRTGLQFRLYFKHPFNLELFLQPAGYDWRIGEEDIVRERKEVELRIMRPLSDSGFTLKMQKKWMRRTFDRLSRKQFRQAHIYTNAYTAYGEKYKNLFGELFKPSPRLEKALEEIQREIGGRYISVSMRFLALLDDFKDAYDSKFKLTKEEQAALLDDCLKRIEELHARFPEHRILVNSDSSRMLEAAERLPYSFVIPGSIIHLDRGKDLENEYDKFEKTFLDFFTISRAEQVFLVKCHERMRVSGFPYSAAMIGEKPFEVIE